MRAALLLVLALAGCHSNLDTRAQLVSPSAQFPADQDARIAEHIKQAGFVAAMQADLAEANQGRQGLTPPPWMLLAKYVDVLERRVAELEREKAQKGK